MFDHGRNDVWPWSKWCLTMVEMMFDHGRNDSHAQHAYARLYTYAGWKAWAALSVNIYAHSHVQDVWPRHVLYNRPVSVYFNLVCRYIRGCVCVCFFVCVAFSSYITDVQDTMPPCLVQPTGMYLIQARLCISIRLLLLLHHIYLTAKSIVQQPFSLYISCIALLPANLSSRLTHICMHAGANCKQCWQHFRLSSLLRK